MIIVLYIIILILIYELIDKKNKKYKKNDCTESLNNEDII